MFDLLCQQCGKRFLSPSNRKTCSRSCADILGTKQRCRKAACTCEVCGKIEMRSPSHTKHRYCSLECKGIASRTITARPCETCGKGFIPPSNHGDQRFCSNACAGKQHRRRTLRTCPTCGKQFHRRGKRTAHYCSVECMSIGYSKPILEIPCAYCGETFLPVKRESVHCSPKCAAKAGAAHRIKLVTCICAYCGKVELRHTKQRRKYCSLDCKRQTMIERRTFNRFTGKQKDAIKARDGYCCVQCGSMDRIQVDHIVALALGGTNDLENGQTLCLACHVTKSTIDRALSRKRREALRRAQANVTDIQQD